MLSDTYNIIHMIHVYSHANKSTIVTGHQALQFCDKTDIFKINISFHFKTTFTVQATFF